MVGSKLIDGMTKEMWEDFERLLRIREEYLNKLEEDRNIPFFSPEGIRIKEQLAAVARLLHSIPKNLS